jgi:hypothetical protein
MYSFVVPLPQPSAMLAGTEVAALLIWAVSPNFSPSGKAAVALYVAMARATALCHTSSSL